MQDSNTKCNSRTACLSGRLSTVMLVAFACVALSACDRFVSADRRVERARTHLETGQFRPAMAELKKALQREPEHVGARIALAELSIWLGDLESTQKELERALQAGASVEEVRSLQYELLLAQKRFDEIETLLETDNTTPAERRLVLEASVASAKGDAALAEEKVRLALEAAPTDPEALLESTRLALARGELEPALSLPERVSETKDVHAQALFLRGLVLMGKGEHSKARDAFTEAQASGQDLRVPEQLAIAAARTEANLALNDVDAAEQSLAGVTRWGKGSLMDHYLRARIAVLKNDFVSAVSESQRALRIQPGHVQASMLLAAAHFSQGSTEQAQDVLTRLLASNPENLAARKLLAQVHLGGNQPEEAERVLNTAGAQDDAELDWLRGAAMIRGGSAALGLQHLERSVDAEPDNITRRVDLAGAYIAARMPEKATEILKAVPADSPLASRAKVLQVMAAAAGKPAAQARREIEQLVAGHTADAALTWIAGAYLVGIGETAPGRQYLERAVAIDPDIVEARLALARLEARSRNVGEAERQLREVIKLEPANQIARLALAELAWAAGDRDQSRKWLEEAISADPSAVDARLRLAQIAFIQGDAPRARGLLDQALSVARDRKVVLTATGRVLARAGLNDEALARFREASAAGHPDALLESARLHMELEQPDKARELIQAGLKSRRDWREAEQLLVMIDARDGQIGRALERAKKLAKDASPAALQVLEGDLYAYAGQREQAISAYEAAQRLQPSSALAIKIYGVKRASDASAAERILTQWLERNPADADVRRVLAAHYESSGQRERAVDQYERLLSAERIDPIMLNNLAWSLHERGDPRAMELAKQAYTASPHYPEIADTYGWILVQMDKVPEGLTVLEKALSNAPQNPDIQYHVAVAYAKSGNDARAVELLRQSLQSSQNFPSRDAAERLLQSVTTKS